MRRISDEQRRARLGRRHHLARPAGSVEVAADDLIGLHATDPVTVFLAARARCPDLAAVDVQAALYDRRSLVRVLAMRRTMWVVTPATMPVVEAAAGRALAAPERRRVAKWLQDDGVTDDGEAWLRRLEDRTAALLEEIGPVTATELSAALPELQRQILLNAGKKWEGSISIASRVLLLLAMEGRAVRARPRGSWVSTQYRWAATRAWLGQELELPTVDAAAAEVARRWLRAFGPATFDDLKWWAGWTVALTRRALAAVQPVEVALDDGGTGLVLADDLEPVSAPSWVALLPALDPTIMGWKERTWYLADHAPTLFDRNGNAGPSVWCDGRVVGGWTQRPSGEIAVELLSDVGADARTAIGDEAERLRQWFGATRFTPRFRTPLERRLAS